jgi:hypothetical protein
MHSSSLLALFMASMATMTSGAVLKEVTARAVDSAQGCYSGGERWGGDLSNALQKAGDFCGRFAGHFKPGNAAYQCYNLSSNKKADFTLGLKGDVPERDIGVDECLDGLEKEINGCDHGGDTTYTNWHYM